MGLLDTLKSAISGSSEPEGSAVLSEQTLGSERLSGYFERVNRINALEDSVEALEDAQLADRIADIRGEIQRGALTVDDALEEVFTIVREATFRVIGLRHYDVQLVGGMA